MSAPHPVKQFGLTQVYAPRGDPTVDIVFVHGLNGHPKDSWTSKSGCFWPVDLLPEVLSPLRPRILTYGYNANVAAFLDSTSRDSILGHAETLASNLAANRNLRNCSERPIIFVCHSLGGLVVKRALIYSRSVADEKTEHLRSVYVSTFGILFLGTPHNGSDVAKWGLLLHNICSAVLPKKVMEASPQLVQALRKDNETLQNINSLFANIMSRFHICLFHETRAMDVKGTRQIIVDEASAAPYLEGVERMGIEADHSHMCKFEDENSPGYEVVAEAILRYSRQAPLLIADRWVEERKARAMEKKAKAREIYDGREDDLAGRSMPDLNERGQLVPALPCASASDGGRNSPVTDLGHSLAVSQCFVQDTSPFVLPPGFHPNAVFVGMQKELEVLHNRLFKAKARKERTTAVLIAGVTGSGKTHLVRQYLFTQRECYPGGVFWIDARSRESSYKCFWEIAQAATLIDRKEAEDPEYQQSQSYVNAVRNWLQSRQEWLLIFDGITFLHDRDITEFKAFLPWNKRCSIIYTSIDATLRKKQRLFEPYCLSMPRLSVEDGCKLLFKELGTKKPTPEQVSKATEVVLYYECLPLAIHAVGHRLKATGTPIEKYRVKYQVTDKKLAEPFLGIMNDLYRLNQRPALHLINLLSFLGQNIPVGLINLGRGAMAAENADILTSAQAGQIPDLDTTLGTLIHHGLIERTSYVTQLSFSSTSAQHSSDEMTVDATPTPGLSGLTESVTEGSQEGFFSTYRGNPAVDVVKMHNVVQQFCRDELRIKDEECNDTLSRQNPGFYDSWLIAAIRFLCKSYEAANEKMTHYHDCGLVRDYREYETHASRLVELFPKKPGPGGYPPVLREGREHLRQLMKSISSEIDRMSPRSSQQTARNQKSVFDRSSSSSSSLPDSADEGLSRESTWNFTDMARAESPEQITAPPRFKLDLFPPHIFRQAGYDSEDGYETDGEGKEAPRVSRALSSMSETTEKPKPSPESTSPPTASDDQNWQVVERHHRVRPPKDIPSEKRSKSRHFGGAKLDIPQVRVSTVYGRGSSSRTPADEGSSSSISGSAAEKALAAVRRTSNSQPVAVGTEPAKAPEKKENVPTYASVAAQRMLEADLPLRRQPAMVPVRGPETTSSRLQMRPSAESLDSQAGQIFASPLAHEVTTQELMSEPLSRSTYSEPGHEHLSLPIHAMDPHTAPVSRMESRRPSLAYLFEPPRDLSASTPSLLPYQPAVVDLSASTPSLPPYAQPLPYDVDITVTAPPLRRGSRHPTGPVFPPSTRPAPVPHPSAIMPGSVPLQMTASEGSNDPKRPGSEPISVVSSALSGQSWVTEPVRTPPSFSPVPGFQQSLYQQSGNTTGTVRPLGPQPQTIIGTGSWAGDIYPSGSALQSDTLCPPLPLSQPRLGSVDERLQNMNPPWNSSLESSQITQFGRHRVDVRDPRDRLRESARLQAPRHIPAYRLYHSNVSGPLVQDGSRIYASTPATEVVVPRPRSGSSPQPPADGLEFESSGF